MKQAFRLLLFLALVGGSLWAQQTVVATITGTGCASIDVTGKGVVGISVTNSGAAWSGTIQPEVAIGGDAAQNTTVTPYNSTTAQNTITANGVFQSFVSGANTFLLCGNTVTNTASVKLQVVNLSSGNGRGGGGGSSNGVPTRASVCTGNVDTVLSTDRANYVTWNDASACAVTLPQAGSAGFAQNFPFVGCDIGAGTATITPTTSTISFTTGAGYTAAASSLALSTGQCAFIYSDNTNYFALAVEASSLADLVDTPGSVLTASVPLAWSAGTAKSGNNPQWFRNSAATLCFAGQGDTADVCVSDTLGVTIGSSFSFAWSTTSGNATATVDTTWSRAAAGYLEANSGTGAGNTGGIIANGGYAIRQNSTTTITTLPAPVKADTSNANQVVVTTTTDTGPDVVVGLAVQGCATGNPCTIINYGVAAPVLGTGTCAIGNVVVVDTTTSGRVKCVAPPTIATCNTSEQAGCPGTIIGTAMAAQSTVGNTFNVLVDIK